MSYEPKKKRTPRPAILTGFKVEKPTEKQRYFNKEKAYLTAKHYGFEGVFAPSIRQVDKDAAKTLRKNIKGELKIEKELHSLESRVAVLRHFLAGTLTTEAQPAIIYYDHPQGKNKIVNLEIIGSAKSVSEALVLRAALAILKEYGHKKLTVEINSMGDKESISKFNRELATFCRKNINILPANIRKEIMKDSLLFLDKVEMMKKVELKTVVPQPVGLLNETSRSHFMEVLEFLEKMGVPYRIKHHLVGHRVYSSHTVFRIVENINTPKEEVLAVGSRFNSLSKKVSLKRDVPAIGVKILIKKPTDSKVSAKKINEKENKFYFIQFGFSAKIKSLEIMEKLREAGISVAQSLSKDKLSSQLGYAEQQKFPYLLIVGQREVIDGTVLVRERISKAQTAVPIENLVEHLKKLM